jgi:hypothetical protein
LEGVVEQRNVSERWEHCSLFSGTLTFFRVDSSVVVEVKRDKNRGDRSDNDAYNRTVAQLGLDGWQFAGMNGIASWFKRRIG